VHRQQHRRRAAARGSSGVPPRSSSSTTISSRSSRVIASDLARDFHVNAGALGGLAAYFFYAYAVLQIPVGLAVDRFGPRWPLTIAIGLAATGSLAFGWAASSGWAGLARLVIGAGAAFSFIACLKLVSNWFAPGRFATLRG